MAGLSGVFFSVNAGTTLLFLLNGWWFETSVLQGGGQALARQADVRKAERRLCNIVSELVIAARLAPPQAMVLPGEWASGRVGEWARAARPPGCVARHLHPAVHHLLLVNAATQDRWFASQPSTAG